MNKDMQILRELAAQYAELANAPLNAEKIALHRAVNDLKMVRPVVSISEIPWGEMDIDGQLVLTCSDPILREAEWFFRAHLFQCKYFRGDMALLPYYPIDKVVHVTGIGLEVKERTLDLHNRGGIISHEYEDQLQTEDDIEKLHFQTVTYDKAATEAQIALVSDVLREVLPVKAVGRRHYCSLWDDIVRLRGATSVFMDVIERPEFMHKIAGRVSDIMMDTWRQMEALELLDNGLLDIHCTPSTASDLPSVGEGEPVRSKNVWGRGMAQIFGSVSKEMHDEFDIKYMRKIMEPFGLVYYGCCEPLHDKIDIVEKIPHLRKISITPWANAAKAAERIGNKYVFSCKPNPAHVAHATFDPEGVRGELSSILHECKSNGCNIDITLKDISTVSNSPRNLIEWNRVAMELVESF